MTTTAEAQVTVSLTVEEILAINSIIEAYLTKARCDTSSSAREVASVRHCLERLKATVAMVSSVETPPPG
jgi:hypothetical protein